MKEHCPYINGGGDHHEVSFSVDETAESLFKYGAKSA
jgi:hypothetical protein